MAFSERSRPTSFWYPTTQAKTLPKPITICIIIKLLSSLESSQLSTGVESVLRNENNGVFSIIWGRGPLLFEKIPIR
jgi:hypothetical protein